MRGQTKIESHRLLAPGAQEALDALDRMFGQRDGAAYWARACREANVPEAGSQATQDELQRIAEALINSGGLEGIVGRTLKIRVLTFRTLGTGQAQGGDQHE